MQEDRIVIENTGDLLNQHCPKCGHERSHVMPVRFTMASDVYRWDSVGCPEHGCNCATGWVREVPS